LGSASNPQWKFLKEHYIVGWHPASNEDALLDAGMAFLQAAENLAGVRGRQRPCDRAALVDAMI